MFICSTCAFWLQTRWSSCQEKKRKNWRYPLKSQIWGSSGVCCQQTVAGESFVCKNCHVGPSLTPFGPNEKHPWIYLHSVFIFLPLLYSTFISYIYLFSIFCSGDLSQRISVMVDILKRNRLSSFCYFFQFCYLLIKLRICLLSPRYPHWWFIHFFRG